MAHQKAIWNVAISTDWSRIVTGSQDKVVRVWDAGMGKQVFQFDGHHARLNSVAISGDGGRIITGSTDKSVRVWDSRNGSGLIEFAEKFERLNFRASKIIPRRARPSGR